MGGILFLAHRVPFPPDRGDRIRAHHLLKCLARLAPVHVGCFAESAAERSGEAELAQLATSYCIAPRTKPLALAGVEAVLAGKPVSLTAFHSRKALEQLGAQESTMRKAHDIARIVTVLFRPRIGWQRLMSPGDAENFRAGR